MGYACAGGGVVMNLARLPGWPLRLSAVLLRARRQRFDWTGHNCAVFAADCIDAVTGVRVHDRFAPFMRTERRARAFGPGMPHRVDIILGADRRVPLAQAQRGDVLFLNLAGHVAMGVCVGSKAATLAPDGLTFVDMGAAQCAWRI